MKALRAHTLAGACLTFCLLSLATTAFAQTTITRIPTLGGSAVDVTALNNRGILAGYSRTADESQHAFVFNGAGIQDLSTLGGSVSLAIALNDNGDVIGDAETADLSAHAFHYRNGVMTDLLTLPGGTYSSAVAVNNSGLILCYGDASDGSRGFLHRAGTNIDIGCLGSGYSSPYGLNNHGHVVGDSMNEVFEHRAFLYRDGVMTNLGTLGGSYSRAWAINDAGVIVGESHNADGKLRAFRYSGGIMQDLGTLGGSESIAFAINDAGDVLGHSWLAGDQFYRSFIVRGGVMMDLGTLGGNSTTADDMNNAGHVVGDTENAAGGSVPFLWRDGNMVDLNTLLPPDSGWVLYSAFHINDAGQIVGFGFYNGEFAWYLLTLGIDDNESPVANAGADQNLECGSLVRLDGSASSDPDGDNLTFEWREGDTVIGTAATLEVNRALGSHTFVLKVTDEHGATAEDSVVVVLRDTMPPNVSCPNGQALPAGPNCEAMVPDFASAAIALDDCSTSSSLVRSQTPAAGTLVGVGTHMVTVTVTDASGNTGNCTVSFVVADTTPPTGDCPAARTVHIGPECQVAVPDFTGALLAVDNCTPADQLVKMQSPAAGTMVGMGSHTVTLTVTDAAGNQSMCMTSLHVVDNTPLSITAPAPVTLAAGADGKVAAPDCAANAMTSAACDADPLVTTQTPAPGTMLGLGTHTMTMVVTDRHGNRASATTTVTVVDRTAPVIQSISVDPALIKNANRDMVRVRVSVVVMDNCDTTPTTLITSITSSDPVTGPGDNTSPDWRITGDLEARVRAERSSKDKDRVYTLTVRSTDDAGNSSTATVRVTVQAKAPKPPKKKD